jgi:hypothetical protein
VRVEVVEQSAGAEREHRLAAVVAGSPPPPVPWALRPDDANAGRDQRAESIPAYAGKLRLHGDAMREDQRRHGRGGRLRNNDR